MQVRAGSRVQHHRSTIKLQEGQGRKAKEDQEIKTAAENPTGAKAANHEKGMENALNFVARLITKYVDYIVDLLLLLCYQPIRIL